MQVETLRSHGCARMGPQMVLGRTHGKPNRRPGGQGPVAVCGCSEEGSRSLVKAVATKSPIKINMRILPYSSMETS